MRLFLSLSLLASIGLFQCKKIPQSDLQTLQDFASNKAVAGNQCQGTNPSQAPVPELASRLLVNQKQCSGINASDAADFALCEDLKRTLTAVPPEVQKAFGDLGGSILATNEASSVCGAVYADPKSPQYAPDAERRKLGGCVMILNDQVDASGKKGSKLVMLVAATKADIGHNIVRMFGYFFGQSVPRMEKTTGADGEVKYMVNTNKSTGGIFASFKTELVRTFFKDMVRLEEQANTKDTYKLENLIPMIGANGPQQIRENIKAQKVDVLEGVTFTMAGESQISNEARMIRAERLRDTVFAEGFDSMNCTAAIREETLNVSFKETGSYYQIINQSILDKAKSISLDLSNGLGLAASEKAAQPSMGLADLNSMFGGLSPQMQEYFKQMLMQMQSGMGGANFAANMTQSVGAGIYNGTAAMQQAAGSAMNNALGYFNNNGSQAYAAANGANPRYSPDQYFADQSFKSASSVCSGCGLGGCGGSGCKMCNGAGCTACGGGSGGCSCAGGVCTCS